MRVHLGRLTTKTGKDFMQRNFHNDNEPPHRRLLRGLVIALAVMAFALFIDWLIINLLLGCCEGGVCWPDIYPQCRNSHYGEFYGKDN
jgi:hypothetical protein